MVSNSTLWWMAVGWVAGICTLLCSRVLHVQLAAEICAAVVVIAAVGIGITLTQTRRHRARLRRTDR